MNNKKEILSFFAHALNNEDFLMREGFIDEKLMPIIREWYLKENKDTLRSVEESATKELKHKITIFYAHHFSITLEQYETEIHFFLDEYLKVKEMKMYVEKSLPVQIVNKTIEKAKVVSDILRQRFLLADDEEEENEDDIWK
jgi:hypothetical protein